ncbi:saccharopine dehydrogenase NADP-binding domain-containing protein [Hyphomicrobium sp.]|uniref:saccharopine dehydrogenase family protein n=1 Tax=Hyphomicrobium sp. TaxID=82 RepID=UPI0025B9472E|nr:saccharopine dehydrogenase NADP-binding domain-containing protein [Hyphomicrobium sp.]MCC7252780.1 saccharopine dehydrogenase NADP-binding domain-containing protein [Hyphomicrobium sp.]
MAAPTPRFSILILGSTGAFGARIAGLLSRDTVFDLTLAGRTRATLEAQADTLSKSTGRPVSIAVLDAERITADDLAPLDVRLVINASGPYREGRYGLARAAIAAGCHYIDLADSRPFVVGFGTLDDEARAAGVLAVSGASSVPGLSSAVVAHHRDVFAALRVVDIAISPGNAFDPGVATVASVLGGVGQPMRMLRDGEWRTVYGWQGLRRLRFGAAGRRWLGYVNVPDLEILPAHGVSIETVRFQAGLEVSLFHLGLWCASWLVRWRLVSSLEPLAPRLLAIKRKLHRLGSDRGGMTVKMRGLGRDGRPKAITWLLVAKRGHGPYVPALAAVALARRLASEAETRRGAMPCHGIVPLADILAEAKHLDITCTEKENPSRTSAGGDAG